jgi:uncharacterized protein
MKNQIKLLGIDDGPFSFHDKSSILIGTIVRGNGYLEGVLKSSFTIDGLDVTDVMIDMIRSSHHYKQLKAVLLDGVTFGGFNIVDIDKIFQKTNLPVITITRDKPDLPSIKQALQNHFSDWKERFNLILSSPVSMCETKHNPIFITRAGIEFEKAKEIITLSTIRGVIPEPIRIAHLIASGVVRGESYGKA